MINSSESDFKNQLVEKKYAAHLHKIHTHTDRLFGLLLLLQWLGAIGYAYIYAPYTWEADVKFIHLNVTISVILGGLLTSLPCYMIYKYPGSLLSRLVIAISQMMMSCLLIHLTGGRIETHFHIFGSLAFLAFYRDWRVLLTATTVIMIDHFFRGMIIPESVYGSKINSYYRSLEHGGWVAFENLFLLYSCYRSRIEMYEIANREVELIQLNSTIEQKIQERTLELKNNEQSLKLWKSAFDVSRDAMIITQAEPTDLPGPRITYVNTAFTEMTGYTSAEVINKTPRILQGVKTDPQTLKKIKEALRNWQPIREELLNYRKDGSEFWVELDISPIADETGWYTHWISIQRDITQRKTDEHKFLESSEILKNLASELEEKTINLEINNHELKAQHELAISASKAKSEFLANMSHEIRTPLTAILGFTDVLLNDGDIEKAPPRRIENINTIRRNGEHLLGILNDILDLSKIEAEKLQVESIDCDPVLVVKDALDLMKVRADSKSIKLEVKWDSMIPIKFHSDPMRLKQIIVNLIGNAIKFTELGGVTLHVNYMNEFVEFSVVDTGIGMSPEQTKHIFEAFQQADNSMSRKFGGTGLGLIISKRLASLMNGDVELVYSTPGKGTCFRLYLHVGEFSQAELFKPEFTTLNSKDFKKVTEESKKPVIQLQGVRILYAEDGLDNQRLVSFMLKKQGAEIDVVENGQLAIEAIERAKLSSQQYDIILMDMQMPVMDGYQASTQLRLRGESIPIIALTAHAMAGERDKCLAAGCSEYTTKPIKKEELFKLISQLSQTVAST